VAAQTGVGVPEVFGVQEVLKALADVEPKLKREAIKKIKMAAEPMRASIARTVWPTAESQLASVQAAVLAAVKEVSLETNVRTAER
jgi:hypothetical protein